MVTSRSFSYSHTSSIWYRWWITHSLHLSSGLLISLLCPFLLTTCTSIGEGAHSCLFSCSINSLCLDDLIRHSLPCWQSSNVYLYPDLLLELRLLGSSGYFTFPIGYLTDSFNFTHPKKWTLNFPPHLICTGAIHMSANGNSCIEVPWLKTWAHLSLYFSHTPSTSKSSANPVGLPSEYNLFSLPSPLSF